MFASDTLKLLESKFPALPKMLLAPSLRHDFDDLVAMILNAGTIAIVDDNDTATVMGDAIARALKSRYKIIRIACGKAPHADAETVKHIRSKSKYANLLIAVGAGTISDLCKYASHLDAKPYIIFPTAASMNGYLSANASITTDGYKNTHAAPLPKAIFCDLSVIAAAPVRLHKSGLGDSLARPTAQTDWLLSHLLLNTPYDETPVTFTQALEPTVFANARGLALSDPSSVKNLIEILLLSGLGMTHAGGSYPASQSEHMLAHTFEMLKTYTPATLHGEQIGVTALTAAARQEQLIARPPSPPTLSFPEETLLPLFGRTTTSTAQQTFRIKQEKIEAAGLTEASLKFRWPDIAHRLSAITFSAKHITEILTQAQAPATIEALGWQSSDYKTATQTARYLRDRFTCLDLNP